MNSAPDCRRFAARKEAGVFRGRAKEGYGDRYILRLNLR